MAKRQIKIKESMIVLMLIFISACDLGKKDEYSPTITSKDIYKGKEGLIMEFFENTPKEIFENSILPIGIRLYNKGAYDITEGYLSIGLEKEYMMVDTNSLKAINEKVNFKDMEYITFDLKGKTIEYPNGEQEIIIFTAETKDLSKTDPKSESHASLVSVTSCYEYQTKAVETVCIDPDIYGLRIREKACQVKPITLNSQGAPVAVTKIESEMLPSDDTRGIVKPKFTITIKNIGNGEIIRKDKVKDACSSEPIGRGEWNTLTIKAYLSNLEEKNRLNCDINEDMNVMILKGKEDSIRCIYEEGFDEKKGAFSSPLYILLEYGYTNTISKEVKIKKRLTR